MKKTDLVLFNKGQGKNVLEDFGFRVIKEGKQEKVVNKNMEVVKCHTCENEIKPERVGTVAHGSRLVFCENPLCFATWVAEKKIK